MICKYPVAIDTLAGKDDMATLEQVQYWLETLERNHIDSPRWNQEKHVFEYDDVTVKVVAFLKLVRAVQSLRSLQVLCENGLFIDFSTIIRCITDCLNEVYFLLETYPDQSSNVTKFIANFRETTIDGHLSPSTDVVESKKIQNSKARALGKGAEFNNAQEAIRRIFKTFSGYIHSNYSHIMQIYGGKPTDLRFQLSGVSSRDEKLKHSLLIGEMVNMVAMTIAFMAQKLGLWQLGKEIVKHC
jgi:hypothetical protein